MAIAAVPLVSVIIPSYNRDTLIGETLNSIMSQTYTNWECIVVDDGSTDNSIYIIESFCKKDKRFRFYKRHRSPKGAQVCRNIGIENTNGKYTIFLDSDDLLANNCIENRVNYIEKNNGLSFVVFQTLWRR